MARGKVKTAIWFILLCAKNPQEEHMMRINRVIKVITGRFMS